MAIQIADALEALYRPKRLKVYFGGRGGVKSWGCAQALVVQGTNKPIRVLCTREFQGSIQESVHKLLTDTIERCELTTFYEVQRNTIIGLNGTTFIFEGLRNNPTKIKSMEALDYVWVEEAENISQLSWDLLIPTVRKSGSEIWVTFNPFDELDDTYTRFITPYLSELDEHGVYEDDTIYVRRTSFRDNPWFPDELRQEMEKCKRDDYHKYLHIWEGLPNADYEDSIIMPEWVDAAVGAHDKLGFKPEGVRCIGFDPADQGSDAKAYSLRHGVVVTEVAQWTDGDVVDAIDKVFNKAFEARADELVYDGIGIGAAIKVKLAHKDPKSSVRATAFIGSEEPANPTDAYMDGRENRDVFRNRRAQGWWLLRDRFEKTYRAVVKGEYIDPDDLISLSPDIHHLSSLKSELVRVQRKRGNLTRLQVESKEDMRKREMPSPNLADSLVYAFSNPPPAPKLNFADIELRYVV
jgi:phage terminase large subunit